MQCKELVTKNIPILSLKDTGNTCLNLMTQFEIAHLPLVVNNKYLCLLSEDELLDWEAPDAELEKFEQINFKPAVLAESNILNASKIFLEFKLTVLPIIDIQNNFIGSISLVDMFKYLAEGSQCMQAGGTIVLQIAEHNYSLSEISRICENDNVIVLSMMQHKMDNNIILTLKTNKPDINSIVATFERYNYTVLEVQSEEKNTEDLKSNYDMLMNYINM